MSVCTLQILIFHQTTMLLITVHVKTWKLWHNRYPVHYIHIKLSHLSNLGADGHNTRSLRVIHLCRFMKYAGIKLNIIPISCKIYYNSFSIYRYIKYLGDIKLYAYYCTEEIWLLSTGKRILTPFYFGLFHPPTSVGEF